MKLIIDPDFRDLIPPLSADELAGLRANIVVHGCRDSLVVWMGHNIILDGHNRYAICTEIGRDYRVTEIQLATREDAMDWIDSNQLGRRNLTPDQMSILRGRIYNRAKKSKGGQSGNMNAGKRTSQIDEIVSAPATTSETLAEKFGVSASTIQRDGKKAAAVEEFAKTNPVEAKAIRDGKKKMRDVMPETIDSINHNGTSVAPIATERTVDQTIRNKAIDYAYDAINCLKKIGKENPQRSEAFDLVTRWIKNARSNA